MNTAALLLLGALSALFAVMLFLGRNEVVTRKLTCPRSRLQAEVEISQRYGKPARPVRVRACSLLPRGKRVDCDQDCLRVAPGAESS